MNNQEDKERSDGREGGEGDKNASIGADPDDGGEDRD